VLRRTLNRHGECAKTTSGRGEELMRIAVVIPCYRVKKHIEAVIRDTARYADGIFVVDDCCPEGTGAFLRGLELPPGVRLLANGVNKGVGGAVITGYRAALAEGFDIIVKLDGDGQMDASLIPLLIEPIVSGLADYSKGNRFFNVHDVAGMPLIRVVGNAGLSFLTKLASGYWDVFDPTNGFIAVHARVLERLPLDRIAERYFFESDMLFRLGTLRAAVVDVPMTAIYGDAESSLSPGAVLFPFLFKNLRNFAKRVFYNYFLRDFSVASVYLALLVILIPIGIGLGILFWAKSIGSGVPATSGEVMLAALPLIAAMQLLLAFLAYDVEATPRRALHRTLQTLKPKPALEIIADQTHAARQEELN
jgi:dolichol-phosphate mannosyltransferase